MKSNLYMNLPNSIKGFLLITEGWLIGNSIKDLSEGKIPKDYDIVITDRSIFQNAVKNWESYNLRCNSYGGMKIDLNDDITIDFWCEELSHFLLSAKRISYVFSMKRNLLLSNI